ncbi:MAG: hypothetical protein ACI9S8_000980 [Chlamydiales bacterium]
MLIDEKEVAIEEVLGKTNWEEISLSNGSISESMEEKLLGNASECDNEEAID